MLRVKEGLTSASLMSCCDAAGVLGRVQARLPGLGRVEVAVLSDMFWSCRDILQLDSPREGR